MRAVGDLPIGADDARDPQEALMSEIEPALRELLDRAAIHDVLMRYCRGVDRCDEELVRSAYHPDAVDDHGYWKGSGWAFAGFIVRDLARRSSATTHAVANESIALHGDTADVESYVFAYLCPSGGEDAGVDLFAGRYVDRFERRDGEWRISRRTVVHDWSRRLQVAAPALGLPLDGFAQGRRDRSDPVFGG
jgi:hypothetical protein